ncbi:MAG: Holliday junction resolvase RuvX [SAR202 cluster bacterium]|nr:Holliday junction resolvase RuvX [SAR202 cluster bacterium]
MRVLALDVGDKRTGVALSDGMGMIATPLTTIRANDEDELGAAVMALIAEHGAGEVVVGMPLTLAGEMGAQAKRTGHFVRHLKGLTALTVKTVDERLSTVEATRRMRETGTRRKKIRENIDAAAAAVVLQAYLDSGGGRD